MAKRPSVIEPIGQAWEWTVQVLFRDADLGKWLTLGFCAFLADLMRGGGGGMPTGGPSFPVGGPGSKPPFGPGGGPPDFNRFISEARAWIEAHQAVVVMVIAGGIVLGTLFMALVRWLNSRGRFMFLDGVVCNRGAVVEPWRRFREPGNSLFWFDFCFSLVSFAGSLLLVAICLALAWPDIQAQRVGTGVYSAILVGGSLGVIWMFTVLTVVLVLDDFVVPLMYYRQARVLRAWSIFWRDVVPGNVWPLTLFYCMKALLGICAAVLVGIGTCLTCCLASLPYIGSVVFLPVFVFMRCYSLFFLEQMADRWRPEQDRPAAAPGGGEQTAAPDAQPPAGGLTAPDPRPAGTEPPA